MEQLCIVLKSKLSVTYKITIKKKYIMLELESRRVHWEGGFKGVGETQLTMTLQNNGEYRVSLMTE